MRSKERLVDPNALIVGYWDMWLTNVISCMVTHLGTISRIKVNKVEVFLLPIMLLLLMLVLRYKCYKLVSLEQNSNNFLVCSTLKVILALKHHMILLLMLIRLPLSSRNLLWIFKGMRCQVSILQPIFKN